MIETKFGLKYPFPHTLVHIVDNSSYTGDLPVVVADEPSMYGTIVVTGSPIGEDRRVIDITRSDVLRVAFGMDSVGTGDIRKYGQTITYPMALINQGGPVKLLRVTPDDATYAYSIVTVEWRWDTNDNMMHVRYNTERFNGNLVGYQNQERLNAAIVRAFANATTPKPESDPTGEPWKKRAFIVNIGAGRGSVYNKFTTMINQTIQPKRPANVRYQFSTVNTQTNGTVEQFYASLMNVENTNRPDAIDSVNVQIKRRVSGSSIVIPFVNEAAITELYNDYRTKLDTMYADGLLPTIPGQTSDYVKEVKTFLTINTFDMIFGNYIYNGTDEGYKLPYFQVDMRSNDVPLLPKDRRVYIIDDEPTTGTAADEETKSIERINKKLLDTATAGITRENDTVHIGDVYLYSSLSSSTNPYLYIVTAINQYTGLLTILKTNIFSINMPGILNAAEINSGSVVATDTPISLPTDLSDDSMLATKLNNVAADQFAANLKKYVKNGIVKGGSTIAAVNGSDWGLFLVLPTATIDGQSVPIATAINKENWGTLFINFIAAYNMDKLFSFIKWSAVNANTGVGNMLAVSPNDAMWKYPAATIIDTSADFENAVFVNNWDITLADSDANLSDYRTQVTYPTRKASDPPTAIEATDKTDMLNAEFDVIRVSRDSIQTYTLDPTKLSITNTSTEYDAVLPELFTFSTGDGAETVFVGGQTIPAGGTLTGLTPYLNKDSRIVSEHSIFPVFTDGECVLEPVNGPIAVDYPAGYSAGDDKGMFRPVASPVEVLTKAKKMDYTDPDHPTSVYAYTAATITEAIISDWANAYTDYWWNDNGTWTAADSTYDSTKAYYTRTDVVQIAEDGRGMYKPGNPQTDTQHMNVLKLHIPETAIIPAKINNNDGPVSINRYMITGQQGSFWKISQEKNLFIPANYYSDTYGINITSVDGGVQLADGYTGFFDDLDPNSVEFKWRYSALLVKAYRGQIDPSIMSPVKVPAKYLFDGATNTIVGQTILPYLQYTVADKVQASTIFTADDKDDVLLNPSEYASIDPGDDIDVKQAMYDFMIYRVYQGIAEDSNKRPIGPGSGLSLHLDSGVVDMTTVRLVNESFTKRFDNPNASWDIGGVVAAADGIAYTFTKQLVDNLINHCKAYTVNKPYTGKYTMIPAGSFTSYFPEIDVTDWDLRELMYNSGGNTWMTDVNGNLTRRSQRTLLRYSSTSDLLQENNMRTLSQLVYLLQNKLDENLFEYDDDDVLKTISDQVNNMFSNWVGTRVQALDIEFTRDKNIDGGDIVVCNVKVTFRGLILRVPIIVNVNRRES